MQVGAWTAGVGVGVGWVELDGGGVWCSGGGQVKSR